MLPVTVLRYTHNTRSIVVFSQELFRRVNLKLPLNKKSKFLIHFESDVLRTRCVINLASLALTISHLAMKSITILRVVRKIDIFLYLTPFVSLFLLVPFSATYNLLFLTVRCHSKSITHENMTQIKIFVFSSSYVSKSHTFRMTKLVL